MKSLDTTSRLTGSRQALLAVALLATAQATFSQDYPAGSSFWISSLSGKWEDAAKWFPSAPSTNVPALILDSPNTKVVQVDGITATRFPDSVSISRLIVSNPVQGQQNTVAVVSMNLGEALRIREGLEIRGGGAVTVADASLQLDGDVIVGTADNFIAAGRIDVTFGASVTLSNASQNATLRMPAGVLDQTGGVLSMDRFEADTQRGGIHLGGGVLRVGKSSSVGPDPILVGTGADELATLDLGDGPHLFGGIIVGQRSALLLAGASLSGAINNLGFLVAQGPGEVTLYDSVQNSGSIVVDGTALNLYGSLVNAGTIRTTNGGTVRFLGPVSNTGIVRGAALPGIAWLRFDPDATGDPQSGVTLKLAVGFDQPMDPAVLSDVFNYTVSPGTVIEATPAPDGLAVTLTIDSAPAVGSHYEFNASQLTDFLGQTMRPKTLSGTVPFYEINYALTGRATQSSTSIGAAADRAIDGQWDGDIARNSVALTAGNEDPAWWQVDLGGTHRIGAIDVWLRTDCCSAPAGVPTSRRDDGFTTVILDVNQRVVWSQTGSGTAATNVARHLLAPVNGRFVRIESRPAGQTGSGALALAEVRVLAPYTNVAVTLLGNLPATVFGDSAGRGTIGPLTALAINAPQTLLRYQWQMRASNFVAWVNLPNETNQTLQADVSAGEDTSTVYRCRASVLSAATNSGACTLRRKLPPQVASFVHSNRFADTWEVTLVFDSQVDRRAAGRISNYQFDSGRVTSAAVGADERTVTLGVENLGDAVGAYTLIVRGIAGQDGFGSNQTTTYNNRLRRRPHAWSPVQIARQGSNVLVHWPAGATLKSAPSLQGPWRVVAASQWPDNGPAAEAIFTTPALSAAQYFKLDLVHQTWCSIEITNVTFDNPVHPNILVEGNKIHVAYKLHNGANFPASAFPATVVALVNGVEVARQSIPYFGSPGDRLGVIDFIAPYGANGDPQELELQFGHDVLVAEFKQFEACSSDWRDIEIGARVIVALDQFQMDATAARFSWGRDHLWGAFSAVDALTHSTPVVATTNDFLGIHDSSPNPVQIGMYSGPFDIPAKELKHTPHVLGIDYALWTYDNSFSLADFLNILNEAGKVVAQVILNSQFGCGDCGTTFIADLHKWINSAFGHCNKGVAAWAAAYSGQRIGAVPNWPNYFHDHVYQEAQLPDISCSNPKYDVEWRLYRNAKVYKVTVRTSRVPGAATGDWVTITLYGTKPDGSSRVSGPRLLRNPILPKDDRNNAPFQEGSEDVFYMVSEDLGQLTSVRLVASPQGENPDWLVRCVEVVDPAGYDEWSFTTGIAEWLGGQKGRSWVDLPLNVGSYQCPD